MAKLIILRGTTGSGKTTVADEIRCLIPSIAIVEVDDIKMMKYATTTRCEPSTDFPEAGRKAKEYLDQDIDVVIIEPFVERNHYLLMLQGAKLTEDSLDVIPIWLNCTEVTALKRKDGVLPQEVVRQQFQRYARRYQPRGELVLSTDDQLVTQIARAICTHVQGAI